MLDYNELKPGKVIILDDQPYVVIDFKFLRMQQRKPTVQTKIRNLISGKTIDKTFQQSDKFVEAEIERRPIKYLYNNKGEFWFVNEKEPSKRFKLEKDLIGDCWDLLKENSIIDALVFNDNIISVKPPIKLELKVIEAPPAFKGDTAQGGSKQVKVETGALITTPLFVNEGDIIRINTETRQYTERAEKA